MKRLTLLTLLLFLGLFMNACTQKVESTIPVEETVITEPEPEPVVETRISYNPPKGSFIEKHGKLSVIGTQLHDENNEPIQLRGMSSHGLQFAGSFINEGTMNTLVNDWDAKLFRIAMYVEDNGYLTDKKTNLAKVENAIKVATDAGLYVIIDWHILKDNNPMKHVEAAKEFFADLSYRYQNYDNLIYEICNEPNGNDVTWEGAIKPYAEIIVPIIRENAPDAIIIIGTPTWSQDVDIAAQSPVEGTNLMYALHFYAGTHGESLINKAKTALSAGLPLFVTEWGTSQASGRGGIYLEESDMWLDFLDENGISWANWSLSSKHESSAAIVINRSTTGDWKEDDLSDSGKYVRDRLRKKSLFNPEDKNF